MKTTTPIQICIRRFLTDRYAYREQPDYLPELIVFGLILIAVTWPLFSVANAMSITMAFGR